MLLVLKSLIVEHIVHSVRTVHTRRQPLVVGDLVGEHANLEVAVTLTEVLQRRSL